MIAQRKHTNDVVEMSDEATVQAAVMFLNRRPTLISYRWTCQTCGMIHTVSSPATCESCGGSLEIARQEDICREMGGRH